MGRFCWSVGWSVGRWKKVWKISKQRRLPELIVHLRLFYGNPLFIESHFAYSP